MWKTIILILACASVCEELTAAPQVSNVSASQRAGTKLVDITYDLINSGGNSLVQIEISVNGGVTWDVPVQSISGAVGENISPGNNKVATWNAGADFDGNLADQCKARVTAYDAGIPAPPPGMVFIPAGPFQMGDNIDGLSIAPVRIVSVSAFFMDRTEVTQSTWDLIATWAVSNGYSPFGGDTATTAFHPKFGFNWYDCVRWTNARSEKDGLQACYYLDSNHTQPYREGNEVLTNDMVDWGANGYRLPTEAEWEKAARGGLTGKRFPWGDTISHDQANYNSIVIEEMPYDVSSTQGYHSLADGSLRHTMIVGSFPANEYGLFDMAGNVFEWVWDRFDEYNPIFSDPLDPRGPSNGSRRVIRGGAGDDIAVLARCPQRSRSTPTSTNQILSGRPWGGGGLNYAALGARFVRIPNL